MGRAFRAGKLQPVEIGGDSQGVIRVPQLRNVWQRKGAASPREQLRLINRFESYRGVPLRVTSHAAQPITADSCVCAICKHADAISRCNNVLAQARCSGLHAIARDTQYSIQRVTRGCISFSPAVRADHTVLTFDTGARTRCADSPLHIAADERALADGACRTLSCTGWVHQPWLLSALRQYLQLELAGW